MEKAPDHPLLQLKYSEIEIIRRDIGITVKSINEAIDDILEWAKKQDHLAEAVEHMDRGYLERIYMLSRGSVEAAKKKIERLCTSRGLMPDLCLNHNLDDYDKVLSVINLMPLPKLSPKDQTRIVWMRFVSENVDDFNMLSYFRYAFLLGEYRIQYEYMAGEHHVIDLKNVKLSLLGKINPVLLKKAEILCSEGYGTRIKGIHFLNAPSFVDKLVFILKTTMKEKVASRIYVHKSYEDLHKHIPKEILPKDYEGDETSCDKLAEQWRDLLRTETATKIIQQAEKRISNEAKRNSSTFNEEYMGMPGSFRRLNVD